MHLNMLVLPGEGVLELFLLCSQLGSFLGSIFLCRLCGTPGMLCRL